MASTSRIKGTIKRTERPSEQEPEWKPTFPSSIVRTPAHYAPYLRQTMEPRRETFLPSSLVSVPTSFVPLHSTFTFHIQLFHHQLCIFVLTSNSSSESPSASSAISANLPSTNYELDHEDQPEPLASNTIQMTQLPPPNSERSTVPWILASRGLHMAKKPMNVEFITRLANIRRLTDGNCTNSSPPASLALGSPVSIAPSAFSQSFSVTSPPHAVEFPPTPVFTDAIPAGLMQKLELLAIEQLPKAPALKNSYYPLQNSHTVIATRSLNAIHEADNSSSTSSPNSTPRQQPMQFPVPTMSVPHYTPNPSRYTPPPQTRTPTQTNPSSNIVQQPSSLTFASTAAPRITKPLPLFPLPSNHSPSPVISPEHNPLPNTEILSSPPPRTDNRGDVAALSTNPSNSHQQIGPSSNVKPTSDNPNYQHRTRRPETETTSRPQPPQRLPESQGRPDPEQPQAPSRALNIQANSQARLVYPTLPTQVPSISNPQLTVHKQDSLPRTEMLDSSVGPNRYNKEPIPSSQDTNMSAPLSYQREKTEDYSSYKPTYQAPDKYGIPTPPLALQMPAPIEVPVHIHGATKQLPHNSNFDAHSIFLSSRRPRTISLASLEAQDGTVVRNPRFLLSNSRSDMPFHSQTPLLDLQRSPCMVWLLQYSHPQSGTIDSRQKSG
jgi:hypothetical protein